MIRNYLKVAWRHLMNNKALSFINIFGLAIGMAFAILIGLWIQYETSYDQFHVNRNRIAMVYKNTQFNNEKNTQQASQLPLYYSMKSEYPEVERASRLDWGSDYSLISGDKKLKRLGRHVDADFFAMCTFPFVKGSAKTAFNDINSMVITESLAAAMFGSADPMGKTIRVNNQYDVKVTGVMKDVPTNSTLEFDFLAPYEHEVQTNKFIKDNINNWGNNFLMNLVELKPGVSMDAFSKKIRNLNFEKDKTLVNQFYILHPMNNWNLRADFKNWVNTGGKIEYIRLFGMIGLFVLLIACINFMNLATARSEKRAKEVGIRKAIGSLRRQLILQFLTETMFTALLSFILAMILIPLVLPLLKDIGFQNIHFTVTNIPLLLSMLGIAIITGLISGSYPALYLSSFLPVKVLKGLFKPGQNAVNFRRVLVVSQFAISVGLIISTVIVFQQINHAKSRSLGYDTNNLLNVYGSKDLFDHFDPLKRDLLNTGYLESVAKTSSPLTAVYNSWSDFSWKGKDPKAQIALDVTMIEWDFDKTVGLKFKQGRPFSKEFKTDSNAIILNEAALSIIGYDKPLGKIIKLNEQTLTIIGVVEDMLVQNPFKSVNPMVILFNPGSATNNIYMRLKPGVPIRTAISAIQPIFEKYNPAYPFEFGFSDEEFARKFSMESQVGKLAAIFAVLAIFISCLGLFGLAAFMAERRTKEIGIRKVLGASLINLWTLLSKEFIWLVVSGCIIATPIAYWLMNGWLQGYDYRITINWWIFIVAGILALVVALVTVSTQAIKAAISNPVNSLRSE